MLEIEVSPFAILLKPGLSKLYRVGQEPEQRVHDFGPTGRRTVPVTRDVVCEATAREDIKEQALSNLELKEVKEDAPFDLARALMGAMSPPETSE